MTESRSPEGDNETGPLPVLRWPAEAVEPVEPADPAPASTEFHGADPDLPWDFATEAPGPRPSQRENAFVPGFENTGESPVFVKSQPTGTAWWVDAPAAPPEPSPEQAPARPAFFASPPAQAPAVGQSPAAAPATSALDATQAIPIVTDLDSSTEVNQATVDPAAPAGFTPTPTAEPEFSTAPGLMAEPGMAVEPLSAGSGLTEPSADAGSRPTEAVELAAAGAGGAGGAGGSGGAGSGAGGGARHGQRVAPMSQAYKRGVAAVIAVAAVLVAIVAFNLASPAPHLARVASGGPKFPIPQTAVTTAAAPRASASAVPSAAARTGTAGSPPSGAGTSAAGSAGTPTVTVLNQTRTHGLAASEAAKLRGAGYTVGRVTNVNAQQPQTTVFYDDSQKAAAEALVAAVPSIKVAAPRPSWLLRTGGLIVVVAADAA